MAVAQGQTIIAAMKLQLLGGLSPGQFLSRHWQKRPLLVRGAIPRFQGFLRYPDIRALSLRDDVESRLVWRTANKNNPWHLKRGPLTAGDHARLPRRDWTVLVQGVNLYREEGDSLLRQFNFIPSARLDDLMVSYAAPGGGVGPHRDSYDVFLLQGSGRRRWRISAQSPATLLPGAPIQVLADFRAEEEWVLEPGDMLYLPPHYAHEGTAVDACLTYSIGFRAPSMAELARALLDRMDADLDTQGEKGTDRYSDANLTLQRSAGAIPPRMSAYARTVAGKLRLAPRAIDEALGCYLTEPKPGVSFAAPARPVTLQEFARRLRTSAIQLDRGSRMLHRSGKVYINGEMVVASRGWLAPLKHLTDTRELSLNTRAPQALLETLHHWYAYGWIHLTKAARTE